MKTLITTSAVVLGTCFVAASAQAGSHWAHTGHSGQGHATSVVSHHDLLPVHSSPHTHSHHHTSQPMAVWHDTTHVDVIPGRWVLGPSGWTYIPPRRVLHVDGHVDLVNGHNHHHHVHTPVRRRVIRVQRVQRIISP